MSGASLRSVSSYVLSLSVCWLMDVFCDGRSGER